MHTYTSRLVFLPFSVSIFATSLSGAQTPTEPAAAPAPAGEPSPPGEAVSEAPEPDTPAADTPVEEAPADDASEPEVHRAPPVSASAAPIEDVTPAAPPAPSAETAPPESEGKPQRNQRPAGEAELLDKHPVDPDKTTFKPGSGLSFQSKDKKFALSIRARVQFRDELEVSQATMDDGMGGVTTGTMTENRFGIRRARLVLKGHVFGEHNKLKAEFAFSPNDMGLDGGVASFTPLFDYYGEFDHLRDLSFRIGQYKQPYSRQRVVSSGDLEFVDRSAAQNEFHLDRDVSAHFFSKDLLGLGFIKYFAGIGVGEGRDAWEQEQMAGAGTAGGQYLARLELLPFGDFDDYSEVDFERLDKFRLSLAGAYAYLENGDRQRGYQGDPFADGGTVDYHNVAADAFFKCSGFTGLVEFYYRDGQRGAPVTPGDTDNLPRIGMGGTGQLGYLIPKTPVGVGARYSELGPGQWTSAETAVEEQHEVGGTVGWYLAEHSLKLQGDYFHLWGADGPAERVRVQLQLAY